MTRAVTSASNLFRRALCPGSEKMEAGIPEQDSDDSREGRLLHRYDANPEFDRSTLTTDQRDILKISEKLDDFIFKRADGSGEHFDHREVELNYLDIPGHADRLRYYPEAKLAVIIDKKFGRKQQTPAAVNKQLRAYAVMAAERITVGEALVAITQPRLPFDERITMAAYTAEDIVKSRIEINTIVANARKPDAPLVAGEEQCRYCKAKIKCPAYAEKYQELLEVQPTLELATPTQISRLLNAIKFADFIKDHVRDIARKMIKDGRLDDWQLGKARRNPQIIDSTRAIGLLQLRGDLNRDEILECCNPSLTKLRDKIREKLNCSWKEANNLIDETLSEVIEIEEKKAPLIPIK